MMVTSVVISRTSHVLVTGGAGFIGSALTRALLPMVASVRVVDNLSSGKESHVDPSAELVVGDILDEVVLDRACRGIDVVFHLAALRSVPRSIDAPHLTNEVNVTGTLRVLEAAAQAGCSTLINSSSSSVYGEQGVNRNHEGMVPQPISPYGVSKLAGEHYCRVWNHLGRIATVSLRYFNVFGPGQSAESKYSAVFPNFISALLRGAKPVVFGDGQQRRDFTFLDDAVAANLAATEAPDAHGLAVNIAAGHARTVLFVLESLSKQIGIRTDPRYEPPRPGDIRFTEADITLAAELLGWAPRSRWEDAIKATVTSFETDMSEAMSLS